MVQKEQTEQDKLVLSLLYTYRSSGECLRIENSSGNTIYTCSRLDRGLCDLNLLITTSGEKIKILSDLQDILVKVPECKESATLSGIITTTQTSDSEITSLREKNSFKTIDSCSTFNFSNSEKLVPSVTYVFLNSTRGKIGIAAKNSINNKFLTSSIKQNAQTCMNNLYTEPEQILLEEFIKNEKLKEVSCTEVTGSKTCGVIL